MFSAARRNASAAQEAQKHRHHPAGQGLGPIGLGFKDLGGPGLKTILVFVLFFACSLGSAVYGLHVDGDTQPGERSL